MVLGLIKDYGSKIWDSIKSSGKATGGFLKEYHQPVLGAIEGATGVLKYVPHPVIAPIAGIINEGLKSMKNKVDDVPNEEIKNKLKEIQNDSEQLTPVSKPVPKTITNATSDVVTRTPSVTVKPNIGAVQHNILQRKAVPYDLMRINKKLKTY